MTIKESTCRGGTGFRHNKARSLLIVAETALALILLIGAGLLLRTFAALRAVNPGFDSHNVLMLRMSLNGPKFKKTAGVDLLVRQAAERLRAIPGVVNAASTCCVPLEGGFGLPFIIQGRPLEGASHGGGRYMISSPAYFDVFKIPLLCGRTFTDQDAAGAPPVTIINQAMAKQYWPNADPLSDRLIIGQGVGPEFTDQPRQIVGIVGDLRDNSLNSDPGPTLYIPQAQVPDGINELIVSDSAAFGTFSVVLFALLSLYLLGTCPVGAVYDRPYFLNLIGMGGHRTPLQCTAGEVQNGFGRRNTS